MFLIHAVSKAHLSDFQIWHGVLASAARRESPVSIDAIPSSCFAFLIHAYNILFVLWSKVLLLPSDILNLRKTRDWCLPEFQIWFCLFRLTVKLDWVYQETAFRDRCSCPVLLCWWTVRAFSRWLLQIGATYSRQPLRWTGTLRVCPAILSHSTFMKSMIGQRRRSRRQQTPCLCLFRCSVVLD